MRKLKKKVVKRKLSIQKMFNITSFTFILACCIFYGSRFVTLHLENRQIEEEPLTFTETIIENNIDNDNFKSKNKEYYFEGKEINNYIKYSNLNWRIIRINSDNTITAILENSITSLADNTSNFEKSMINYWLNNQNEEYTGILENSLNKTDDYLTYTNTCNDILVDTNNITCKEKTQDILITIPSINDYISTGGESGFMNNNEYYYLINSDNNNNLLYVDKEGQVNISDKSDILGIKPVITFKNTIKLISGNGSIDDPYIIEEKNGLFGSYVKLGNDIWRIYSIDDDNVKLSLDTYLTINNEEVKYKYSTTGYYHNDTKSGSLAYYLKNTYIPTLPYSKIIKETSYSNGIYSNNTNFDYKEVLKTTIDTKMTVLSIGNIFLNPINTNYYVSTGISENSNLIYVMSNDFKVYTKIGATNLKIVPVISINKNLLEEGEGTKENPLEVNYE